jgi:hypothetical protein
MRKLGRKVCEFPRKEAVEEKTVEEKAQTRKCKPEMWA